jgi:hypothetical protein
MTLLDPLSPRPWKGIDYLVLEQAGIVVEPELVRIPYREPDGSLRFWRVKHTAGREWFEPRPTTVGGLIPWGLETLPTPAPGSLTIQGAAVFVLEGESDRLALLEAFAWWESFPRGVFALSLPGAGAWAAEWDGYLRPFSVVYVIGDGDEPGRRMATTVRRSAPWVRPVELAPGDDVRAVLQRAGGIEELLDLIADADRVALLSAAIRANCSLDSLLSPAEPEDA